MKKHLNLLLVLMLTGFLAACNKTTSNNTTALADAYDSHGKPIMVSNYAGKWIIVNYWAPWCKPCLKEMPELNKAAIKDKNRIVILGVSYDPLSDDQINQFATKVGIDFPLMQSFPMEKWGVNEISVLPMTFVISPDGKLVRTLNGPQTRASLERALGINTPVVAHNKE